MTKTQIARRREICYTLQYEYQEYAHKLNFEEYVAMVLPRALELCKKAFDDGIMLSMSKHDKVYCSAVTSAYDAFRGGVFLW